MADHELSKVLDKNAEEEDPTHEGYNLHLTNHDSSVG